MSEDTAERLEALEEDVQLIFDDLEQYRSQKLEPTLDELQAARDDAREQRVELQAAVDALGQRVAELERTMDSLVGVEEADDSNPAKRANDLRTALLRQARERTDQHAGKAAMHYREVQEFFARTGHGDVKKPDCYKAMYWAAGERDAPEAFQPAAGFEIGTTTNDSGREVTAITVDADVVEETQRPSYGESDAEPRGSRPTTAATGENTPAGVTGTEKRTK